MNHSIIRIISRYTAIDEGKHHYDLDGFPDLESYFIPKCKSEKNGESKKKLRKDKVKTRKKKS